MSRNLLPVAIVLFVLLILVTGFAAESGLHIQDGMYRIGVDDPKVAALFTPDARFTVYQESDAVLATDNEAYDLVIIKGVVSASPTGKGRSAENALERDYAQYRNSVYANESDLFAAYPLWIDTQSVESELNFSATQNGQYVQVAPGRDRRSRQARSRTSRHRRPRLASRRTSSGRSWPHRHRKTRRSPSTRTCSLLARPPWARS